MMATVVPQQYLNFFSVSAQVSAALIGLLFVSVSITTENIFGERASLRARLVALSAFTALVNTFFLSLGSILPNPDIGVIAITLGALALGDTAANALLILRSPDRLRLVTRVYRSLPVLFGAGLYAYELVLGILLQANPGDIGALSSLTTVIIAEYAFGLSRAWQLLGGPAGSGIISRLRALVRRDAAGASGLRGHASSTNDTEGPQ
ncbi:MAG: hypothetical protein JOZ75_05975 [Candidatus Dormibacteraeota bacterium]|nr:hypothetical protein [Candidatus Dormibacteraeota bacterium]